MCYVNVFIPCEGHTGHRDCSLLNINNTVLHYFNNSLFSTVQKKWNAWQAGMENEK